MEGRKHRNILGYVKKLDLNQLNKLVFWVGFFGGQKMMNLTIKTDLCETELTEKRILYFSPRRRLPHCSGQRGLLT